MTYYNLKLLKLRELTEVFNVYFRYLQITKEG